METDILDGVRDAEMAIMIDTRLQARLSNGRTEQEATDDVIIHLSTLGEDDFQKGIAILRQREFIAYNIDIYFLGWHSVFIGPSGSGQGVTTLLTGQEMELLPFGARRLIPDPNLDFHGQLTVNFDVDIAQPDITWITRGGISHGAPQQSISEAIDSLPRQTHWDGVTLEQIVIGFMNCAKDCKSPRPL
ncbi:uncharacterized protein N7503_000212 [Penicillium pulvis]|uniref:uncharacterized protein n=1 Tax=Penicillium pulvis TaxID=1562058 RepID=UPI002549116B|nr:uncharacterized protein N7503_000212 [Penicillium pulvis]KAJ5813462.1 hypothetical protein N7503_000212 [Penicillium pulvis]